MVILFMLFLVQFSVACACLAVNKEQQRSWAKAVGTQGWILEPTFSYYCINFSDFFFFLRAGMEFLMS